MWHGWEKGTLLPAPLAACIRQGSWPWEQEKEELVLSLINCSTQENGSRTSLGQNCGVGLVVWVSQTPIWA